MEENNRSLQDYLSIGYLFLIVCGLTKDLIFYGFLGVNIIDYSSITDVLLSPISYMGSSKLIMGFLILMLVLMYITRNKAAIWHKKYRDRKWYNMGMDMTVWDEYYASPPSFEKALPFVAFTMVCFFLGAGIGGGMGFKYKVTNNGFEANRKILFQDKESIAVRLIGQNSQYIFYVYPDDPTIHIAPIQGNIKKMEMLVSTEDD